MTFVMFIPNYPNFTVVEFDGLVYEEVKLYGDKIVNLFIEDLQLKYLPDDLFLFIPNLRWLDLRYVLPRRMRYVFKELSKNFHPANHS